MRTTLAIDDDELAAVRQLAERQNTTVGAVISTLVRQSLHKSAKASDTRNGVALLARRKGLPGITQELVNQLRDEAV